MRFGSILLRLTFTLLIGGVIGTAFYLTNRLHHPVATVMPDVESPMPTPTPTVPVHHDAPVNTQGNTDEVVLEFMKRELAFRLAGDDAQANKAREDLRNYLSNHKE